MKQSTYWTFTQSFYFLQSFFFQIILKFKIELPAQEQKEPSILSELDHKNYFRKNISHPSTKLIPKPLVLVLDLWKINFEKSNSTNWIFSLFQTWFLVPAKFNFDSGRLKIQFVKLDFYNLIFKKSSTDQQRERETNKKDVC